MAEDESDPPKEAAIRALFDGVNSLRAAVGHAEEYVSTVTNRLPFSVRTLVGAAVGIILTALYDQILQKLSQATASLPSLSELLGPIEVTLGTLIVWIFYLLLVDIGITVVGINALARQVSSMEEERVRSDGGENIEQPLIPRWTWVLFVTVHATFGAFVGQSFGRLGLFVGLTVGFVIGDELYRQAKDGLFFASF